MAEVLIRPYVPADRESVRHICCETADCGNPVESILPDRHLVADLMTRYYTDYEPQATWVAGSEGRVVGYLSGTVRPQRFFWINFVWVAPIAILRAIGRGVLFRRSTWRLLGAALTTWVRGGFHRRVPLRCYPCHLHINVQPEFRGQRVGQRLIERFLEQMRAARQAGVHVAVREDNPPAQRLFQRLGFTELSRHPFILPNGSARHVTSMVMYARRA